MKAQSFSPKRRTLLVMAPLVLAGCVATVPPNAFIVTDELLQQRQLQSRRFDGLTEQAALIASSDVLQDMGYNLENSEVALGVLTASKDRDATNAGEIIGAVLIAAFFGVATPVSKSQKIRVSLIVQPAGKESIIASSYASSSGSTAIEAAKEAIKPLSEDTQKDIIEIAQKPANYVVRVTFQRIITRTDNSIHVQTINDSEVYQEFFDKLSKSIFIEAQQV